MKLEELSKEQKQQLKIRFLDELLLEEENRNISYGEMANIDEIIDDNDEDFIEQYGIYTYVPEDFYGIEETDNE